MPPRLPSDKTQQELAQMPNTGDQQSSGPPSALGSATNAPVPTKRPAEELSPEQGEPPEATSDGKRSKDVRRLMTALALVQGEVENAKKSRANAHFKTKYADLVAITDACRDALSRHLIAWVQIPHVTPDEIWLETILTHGPSGQFITGDYPIPSNVRGNSQNLVAAITYGRRTSLASMVGVASEDEDDDAESLQDRGQDRGENQDEQRPQQKSQNTLKAEQWADWMADRKIPSLKTADELVALEEKSQADIAALTRLSPEHHAKVKAALAAAGERLGLKTAEEPGG